MFHVPRSLIDLPARLVPLPRRFFLSINIHKNQKDTTTKYLKSILLAVGIPEKWDPGPGTSTGGTPKCLGVTRDPQSGTQDPKIFKWDPGPPKWARDPGPQNI